MRQRHFNLQSPHMSGTFWVTLGLMWLILNAGPTVFISPKTGRYLKACKDLKHSAHVSSCVPAGPDLQA